MKNKNIFIGLISLITITILLVGVSYFTYKARAEQSGGSPESGATSRIKTTYDSVVALGFGSDAAGGWGDWGAYWNRIRSAAEFAPSGNATAATDVRNTKTFYSNTRVQQTGTYPASSSCSTQQYHDSHASATPGNNCSITWVDPGDSITGNDKKDPRTGLIWSWYLKNNAGTVNFVVTAGNDWSWDGTTDADSIAVGNKTASQLCSERGDGWRLPTEKEMMQAYIDGSNWNLTNPAHSFWSLTEYSPTNALYVNLSTGNTYFTAKTTSYYVRCVR